MSKIKIGFFFIGYGRDLAIVVDENTGNKYLMTGLAYYGEERFISGLTTMFDKYGKPDKFSPEEIDYLKSIAIDLTKSRDVYKNFFLGLISGSGPVVGYKCIEI